MSETTIFRQKGVRWICIWLLAVFLIALASADSAKAESNWAATLYTGRLIDGDLNDIPTGDYSFEDAYFVCFGLKRRIYTFRNYFNLELEGRVSKFFGDQDNWELGLLGYFRWLPFPWDRYLDTSFAAGAGLSYATSLPETEIMSNGQSALLLGALSFEFTFALPATPQWNLVAGLVHHRSGAGGTFSGVKGASNGWGIGLRYKF